MNTFNKKSLCVAIAATGLLGVGGAAEAVNLSENGTGNVLIFPYYTVRTTAGGNAYNTYMNITNTTSSTKAVKVRFREGRASKEVLDFNVFLSPFDMWAAAVSPSADGAQISTSDLSCTIPSFTPGVPVPFRNTKYTGDGGGDSLDRTREGYIEVLEMATYPVDTAVYKGSLHNTATGRPADCSLVTDLTAAAGAAGVNGGLMGSLQLINPGAGASASFNPTALDNFYPAIPGFSIYRDTGSPNPDMTDSGTTSAVKWGTQLAVSTGWGVGTADAVSAVLMHNAILNEYILDNGTLSKTDWVVTMPTKNAYVSATTVRPPFQNPFPVATGKSCDDTALLSWDREERFYTQQAGGPDFSPKPPGPNPNIPTLCYEANVVTFNNGNVLASSNVAYSVDTKLSDAPGDKAQNGWMNMAFPVVGAAHKLTNANTTFVNLANAAATAAAPATYFGLPVVGFSVWTYTNTALKVGSVVSNVPTNYGMGVDHKSRTSITP